MEKFSIIIPVYNVQDYLRECLDSVIGQKEQNCEILLVDDGSTDGSGNICDEYALKDSRIKVFHQKNGGLGVARNTGILHATGEWILFVDSDDYWLPDTLEKVETAIAKHPEEKLFAFRYMEDREGKIVTPPQKGFREGRDTVENFLDFLTKYEMTAGWAVWKLAVHRDLIYGKDETLLFLPNVSHGEDLYWVIRLFERAGQIYYIDTCIYRYRIRGGSLSGVSPENCMKWRESLNNTFDWFQEHEQFDPESYARQFIAIHYLPHVFDSADLMVKKEWKRQYGELKKIEKYIPHDYKGKRGIILSFFIGGSSSICFTVCRMLKK